MSLYYYALTHPRRQSKHIPTKKMHASYRDKTVLLFWPDGQEYAGVSKENRGEEDMVRLFDMAAAAHATDGQLRVTSARARSNQGSVGLGKIHARTSQSRHVFRNECCFVKQYSFSFALSQKQRQPATKATLHSQVNEKATSSSDTDTTSSSSSSSRLRARDGARR